MRIRSLDGFSSRLSNLYNANFQQKRKGLFHYTNIDGCKNIIENQYFHASHIQFQNDWQEYNIGYSILTEMSKKKMQQSVQNNDLPAAFIKSDEFSKSIEKLLSHAPLPSQYYDMLFVSSQDTVDSRRKMLPEVFSVSFCSNGDSLNNWITYAKESGVSIEFDFTDFYFIDKEFSKLLENNKDISSKYVSFKILKDAELREIYYCKEGKHDKKINMIFNEAYQLFCETVRKEIQKEDISYINRIIWTYLSSLYSIVPFIKHNSFSGEAEVRIATRGKYFSYEVGETMTNFLTPIHYKHKNGILIPYIILGWQTEGINHTPIKSITIGPGQNQEKVQESLIHFIEHQETKVIPRKDVNFKVRKTYSTYITSQGIEIKKSKIPYIF